MFQRFIDNSKVTALAIFGLFISLVFNLLPVATVIGVFLLAALQGVLASFLIQPIFQFVYGAKSYKDVKIKERWCDLKIQLEEMVDELSLGMPSLAYKDDPNPNAFSVGTLIGNGMICVSSGLISKIDSLYHFDEALVAEVKAKRGLDTEPTLRDIKSHLLRSILAHELGHIYHRHGLKKGFMNLSFKAILKLVSWIPLFKIPFLGSFIKARLLSIPAGYHSRSCEDESDSFAAKNGYPVGLAFALDKVFGNKDCPLEFHSKDFAEPMIQRYKKLTATHPDIDVRIDNIRDMKMNA